MQNRNIINLCVAAVALFELSACSQSKQNDSLANPDQSASVNRVNTNVSVDQNGTPIENGHVVAQPFPANGQTSGDTTNADGTPAATGYMNDRQVNVNAPFTDVNVNRDSGSVHINVPFVHINKEGRGQGTHIDIGGDHSDSN